MNDPYKVLGVDRNATDEEIVSAAKAAYAFVQSRINDSKYDSTAARICRRLCSAL